MLKRLYSTLGLYLALTGLFLKSYVRDRQAGFWTLVFPLLFMIIFGFLNFGGESGITPPEVGVANNADTAAAEFLVNSLQTQRELLPINTTFGSEEELREALNNSSIDVLFIVPAEFGSGGATNELGALYRSDANLEYNVASAVFGQLLLLFPGENVEAPPMDFNLLRVGAPSVVTPEREGSDRDSTVSYRLFLIPGIIAMTIMQSGLFGITFSLVGFRTQGVFRRLQATPMGPIPLMISLVLAQLVILAVQVIVLIGVALAIFGDFREFVFDIGVLPVLGLLVLSLLGGVVFITFGYAVGGRAASPNAAAPLANAIALPMLFLSGIFFSTSFLPNWLETITQFLPLSFLVDASRSVFLFGDSFWSGDVWLNILGLVVWTGVGLIAARFLFRWR